MWTSRIKAKEGCYTKAELLVLKGLCEGLLGLDDRLDWWEGDWGRARGREIGEDGILVDE